MEYSIIYEKKIKNMLPRFSLPEISVKLPRKILGNVTSKTM